MLGATFMGLHPQLDLYGAHNARCLCRGLRWILKNGFLTRILGECEAMDVWEKRLRIFYA